MGGTSVCEGQASGGQVLHRGHDRQRVINMGDRLIWPATKERAAPL